MSFLGVHCSVAGGLENAFAEAAAKRIDTFQIFTRNQRQWHAKPVTDEEREKFESAKKNSGIKVMFSHCSYLLNLASSLEDIYRHSIEALTEEVVRCTQLGLSFCVLHPGSCLPQDREEGIKRIAKGLQQVIRNTPNSKVKIALENTAGQGNSVGGPFENLHLIFNKTGGDRIGYCLDTCHLFVQGYDIRTEKGIRNTLKSFDKVCGLKNLLAFHLNDSKGELGSHLDRHEHIGKGKIGLIAFRYLIKNFPGIPKVLETKKEDDWDYKNLAQLRSFM